MVDFCIGGFNFNHNRLINSKLSSNQSGSGKPCEEFADGVRLTKNFS